MPDQITLEEALKLVSFKYVTGCGWQIRDVHGYVNGNVHGYVNGYVYGTVKGDVCGNVDGNVYGDVKGYVKGDVFGTINGREWESVETPKEKLQRLITESGNQELIDTFNQMQDN